MLATISAVFPPRIRSRRRKFRRLPFLLILGAPLFPLLSASPAAADATKDPCVTSNALYVVQYDMVTVDGSTCKGEHGNTAVAVGYALYGPASTTYSGPVVSPPGSARFELDDMGSYTISVKACDTTACDPFTTGVEYLSDRAMAAANFDTINSGALQPSEPPSVSDPGMAHDVENLRADVLFGGCVVIALAGAMFVSRLMMGGGK